MSRTPSTPSSTTTEDEVDGDLLLLHVWCLNCTGRSPQKFRKSACKSHFANGMALTQGGHLFAESRPERVRRAHSHAGVFLITIRNLRGKCCQRPPWGLGGPPRPCPLPCWGRFDHSQKSPREVLPEALLGGHLGRAHSHVGVVLITLRNLREKCCQRPSWEGTSAVPTPMLGSF